MPSFGVAGKGQSLHKRCRYAWDYKRAITIVY